MNYYSNLRPGSRQARKEMGKGIESAGTVTRTSNMKQSGVDIGTSREGLDIFYPGEICFSRMGEAIYGRDSWS